MSAKSFFDKVFFKNSQNMAEIPAESVDLAIIDPFAGSGTTLKVAKELGRHYV